MTGMRPILIMPSSLAVGAAITASVMEQARSEAEKRGVTLVIEPVGTDPYVPTVLPTPDLNALRVACELSSSSCDELPFMRKESARERSQPNQPWYAQFQKKRGRKKTKENPPLTKPPTMPRVNCTIELVDLPGDNDRLVPSIELTCDRCGHTVESFGQRGRSLRRCLAVMAEECPRGEKNFYTTEEKLDD